MVHSVLAHAGQFRVHEVAPAVEGRGLHTALNALDQTDVLAARRHEANGFLFVVVGCVGFEIEIELFKAVVRARGGSARP